MLIFRWLRATQSFRPMWLNSMAKSMSNCLYISGFPTGAPPLDWGTSPKPPVPTLPSEPGYTPSFVTTTANVDLLSKFFHSHTLRVLRCVSWEIVISAFEYWYFTNIFPFYPRGAMLAWVFATATCLSVRLSVCHTPVLCIGERKQDREMYTIW